MASALGGSPGRASRHHRRAGLILARLPLLVLLAVLLGISHSIAVKAENEPGPPGDADEEAGELLTISSCDDLPDELTEVYGVVAVMGDIVCPENRIVRVSQSMGGEVAFVADFPVGIKGVQFEVPSDTLMAFGAPLLTFEKEKGSTQEIFSVHGSLVFFAEVPLPVPEGSTPEDAHSIMRVSTGGSVEADGDLHFTENTLTVAKAVEAPDPIDRDSRWAQRPRHQNHATHVPPSNSMFAPLLTSRESFGERLKKGPMHLLAGEELHWPSSMFGEDGAMLTLGVDGSLLFKNQAAAYVEADGDPVEQPLVTLIAADFGKATRALKKRLTRGGKAVDADLPCQKDNLKVPGCAGSDAGGRTILTVTDEGGVEVTIDGKRVLHKTEPNKGRTRRRKFWDLVKGRKRPKGNYEMHMVSDGFEVRLNGATVWGVHSTDLPPVVS